MYTKYYKYTNINETYCIRNMIRIKLLAQHIGTNMHCCHDSSIFHVSVLRKY